MKERNSFAKRAIGFHGLAAHTIVAYGKINFHTCRLEWIIFVKSSFIFIFLYVALVQIYLILIF
jgi:hypothetical protein